MQIFSKGLIITLLVSNFETSVDCVEVKNFQEIIDLPLLSSSSINGSTNDQKDNDDDNENDDEDLEDDEPISILDQLTANQLAQKP